MSCRSVTLVPYSRSITKPHDLKTRILGAFVDATVELLERTREKWNTDWALTMPVGMHTLTCVSGEAKLDELSCHTFAIM